MATIEMAHAALTRRESLFGMEAPSMIQALLLLFWRRAVLSSRFGERNYRLNLTDLLQI
jgi:hypothetical protein